MSRASIGRFLRQFPLLNRVVRRVHAFVFPSGQVSYAYKHIGADRAGDEAQRLRASWQSDLIPARQRELVDRQLALYREGKPIDVFDVFAEALLGLSRHAGGASTPRTLLEIGCSSGFYSEVIQIKGLNFTYSGCDYSPAFIKLGQEHYPGLPLSIEDATALTHDDASFEVVVSGCCLLHIPEFEKAISETARVAKQFAVFHRTPVVTGLPHQYFHKKAYGVDTVEIHFNEEQLLDMFNAHGLKLLHTLTLSQSAVAGHPDAQRYDRTYVCEKVNRAV